MRANFKRGLALILAVVMCITAVSGTGIGTLNAKAAGNAPKVEYSFEEIAEMASIPVMNLTMADSS